MKPISIVIITLNEEKRIGRLLSDLVGQNYRHFEVILVDSNSDDLTLQVAKGYQAHLPDMTVHKMDQRGVSLGRNTGAALAKHERLLFLDADVRLSPDFLDNAMQALEESKLEVAGVYRSAQHLSTKYKLGYSLFNLGLYGSQFFFPTAVGACLFSTQRVHKELNGFDEQIELCEDCDYVKRAAKTWRYRMLPASVKFEFDPRRFEQDGYLKTGGLYLKANLRRLFLGEMRNREIPYQFGHYEH